MMVAGVPVHRLAPWQHPKEPLSEACRAEFGGQMRISRVQAIGNAGVSQQGGGSPMASVLIDSNNPLRSPVPPDNQTQSNQ